MSSRDDTQEGSRRDTVTVGPSSPSSPWQGNVFRQKCVHACAGGRVRLRGLPPATLVSTGSEGLSVFMDLPLSSPSPDLSVLRVSQLPPNSPRSPPTRSACQGAWPRSCARRVEIPSLSSTGTRRARRSTPSVSRWLSQCTTVHSFFTLHTQCRRANMKA